MMYQEVNSTYVEKTIAPNRYEFDPWVAAIWRDEFLFDETIHLTVMNRISACMPSFMSMHFFCDDRFFAQPQEELLILREEPRIYLAAVHQTYNAWEIHYTNSSKTQQPSWRDTIQSSLLTLVSKSELDIMEQQFAVESMLFRLEESHSNYVNKIIDSYDESVNTEPKRRTQGIMQRHSNALIYKDEWDK